MKDRRQKPESFEDLSVTSSTFSALDWGSDLLLIDREDKKPLENGERLIRIVVLIAFITVMIFEVYLILQILNIRQP
jgi:hypothetical protein